MLFDWVWDTLSSFCGSISSLLIDQVRRVVAREGQHVVSWGGLLRAVQHCLCCGAAQDAFACVRAITDEYLPFFPANDLEKITATVMLCTKVTSDVNIPLSAVDVLWTLADTASKRGVFIFFIRKIFSFLSFSQ